MNEIFWKAYKGTSEPSHIHNRRMIHQRVTEWERAQYQLLLSHMHFSFNFVLQWYEIIADKPTVQHSEIEP